MPGSSKSSHLPSAPIGASDRVPSRSQSLPRWPRARAAECLHPVHQQQQQGGGQVERNQHRPCPSGNSLQLLLLLSCNKLYIIAKKEEPSTTADGLIHEALRQKLVLQNFGGQGLFVGMGTKPSNFHTTG